jgi:hypothetical protein
VTDPTRNGQRIIVGDSASIRQLACRDGRPSRRSLLQPQHVEAAPCFGPIWGHHGAVISELRPTDDCGGPGDSDYRLESYKTRNGGPGQLGELKTPLAARRLPPGCRALNKAPRDSAYPQFEQLKSKLHFNELLTPNAPKNSIRIHKLVRHMCIISFEDEIRNRV